MKILLIISLFIFSTTVWAVEGDANATQETTAVEETQEVVEETQEVVEETQEVVEETQEVVSDENNVTDAIENQVVQDDNTTIIQDESTVEVSESNTTIIQEVEKPSGISKFEKMFANHTAYNNYQDAIKSLYKLDYKTAYESAMKAKAIYYPKDADEIMIPLPFMPSYMRESAYAPKRTYYKIVKYKVYELKRAIIKIKLLSPPIASVIVKRTSTYIDIIIRNYGDLPLDNFELLLNNESVIKYSKILPDEEKTYRYDLAPMISEIGFKEEFGFAPNSILLDEGL